MTDNRTRFIHRLDHLGQLWTVCDMKTNQDFKVKRISKEDVREGMRKISLKKARMELDELNEKRRMVKKFLKGG